MDYLAAIPLVSSVSAAAGLYSWYSVEGGKQVMAGNTKSVAFYAKRMGTRVIVAGTVGYALSMGLDMTGLFSGTLAAAQPLLVGGTLYYVYSRPTDDTGKMSNNPVQGALLHLEMMVFKVFDQIVKD